MASFNVSRDHSGEAWFRIGRLDVTTTLLVVLLGTIGTLVSTFVPTLGQTLLLNPTRVLRGEVWRVVTWPLVDMLSLFTVLSLVLLWYFGRDLEAQIGRRSMVSLFVGMWAALTVISLAVNLLGAAAPLYGLGLIQFLVLLLWIADNPQRPFFFGIRAWVVGAVLLGLQVLLMLAGGMWPNLIVLVGALLVTAVTARRLGLLTDLTFLPGRPRAAAPRVPRVSRSEQRVAHRRAADADRIDELLEKISSQGMHSLTPAERRELEKLRQRRQSR